MSNRLKKLLGGIKNGINWIKTKNPFKKKKEEQLPIDLVRFKKERYDKDVSSLLNSNPETNIIFLDGGYGMGKTKFVKDILGIKDEFIFSPWLNNTDDVLETIFYQIKGKRVKESIEYCFFVAIAFVLFNSYLSSGKFSIKMVLSFLPEFKCVYIVAFALVIISLIVFFHKENYTIFKIMKKINVPIMDKLIIKQIEKSIKNNSCIVVEDIDRCTNIENVLISLNKLSKQMNNKKKYILITGDKGLVVNKLSEQLRDNKKFLLRKDEDGENDFEATTILKKSVSKFIKFADSDKRISSIVKQKTELSPIEMAEIEKFMSNNGINIRSFVAYVDQYKASSVCVDGQNIPDMDYFFESFIDYYIKDIYSGYKINKEIKKGYSFDFPVCLNDVEVFYQRRKRRGDDTKKIDFIKEWSEIIAGPTADEFVSQVFCKFLQGGIDIGNLLRKYSDITEDEAHDYYNSGRVKYEYNEISNSLENFLLSRFNYEGLFFRRCYFKKLNNINYIFRMYNNPGFIPSEDYCYIIFAQFVRQNSSELKKNYPEIYAILTEKYPRLMHSDLI